MLIIGLPGGEADGETLDWLRHPAVGGVILFARNVGSAEDTAARIRRLRQRAGRPLLVCVDQEGGRVQRCRDGLSILPPLACVGALPIEHARVVAREHGWLMAAEMRALDFDLSFAPVLDLARGNRAIGDRALHADAERVAELGLALIAGMAEAGMAACGKHFPGHGSVAEDTHQETACDPRPFEQIEAEDLLPFRCAFAAGLSALMMAHVVYPAVSPFPAGRCPTWVGELLRRRMGFAGLVFSDDIAMAAAGAATESVADRVHAHLEAGCDLVLVCDPTQVPAALAAYPAPRPVLGLERLRGRPAPGLAELAALPRWQRARRLLALDENRLACAG